MAKSIIITADGISQKATLNDTECAKEIWDALPIETTGSTWGDEIYFDIDVECGPEDPKETVELGDLGYWMSGSCFCIFYGKTPMSQADEIRPASPVNVIGKLEGDPKDFLSVSSSPSVKVEKTD